MNIKHNKIKSGVYLIINNITGEYYGGSSVNMYRRWNQHRRNASVGSTKCPILYNAMRKYGINNFSMKPLVLCDGKDLFLYEQLWLDVNVKNENCYNVSEHADSPTRGKALSEEHKNSLRKPRKFKLPRKRGYSLSEQVRNNISKSLKGKPKTQTHRENIRKSVIGKSKTYNGSRNGVKNPNSKLSANDVTQIRNMFNAKNGRYKMYKEIGIMFGVSWGTVRNVIEGITYAS